VNSNDGMMFVYNPKDYTVSRANSEGIKFLNQLPEQSRNDKEREQK